MMNPLMIQRTVCAPVAILEPEVLAYVRGEVEIRGNATLPGFRDFQVAYGADLNKVREIMLAAAANHPRVISSQEPRVLLTGFGDNGINMELRIWMMDPEEGLGRLKSDINWAIWEAFQREGIEIPFPQRVVHMIEPGNAI